MAPWRLGQHFLADSSWRARICRSLCATPGDVWVEIGAGHGEMTREIARVAQRVIAVELDAPLVEELRGLARELPNVEVVAGDILAISLLDIARAERFRVYGSLPYYITSPILRRLFECAEALESIHVVIQYEVATRLVARPGRRDYGFLSVLTQFYSQPEILFRIPPGAFRPAPKVASALAFLPIRRNRASLGVDDEPAFLRFVGECFGQKRKTLLNNLKSTADGDRVKAALLDCGLRSDARAEQLGLAQFVALHRKLS